MSFAAVLLLWTLLEGIWTAVGVVVLLVAACRCTRPGLRKEELPCALVGRWTGVRLGLLALLLRCSCGYCCSSCCSLAAAALAAGVVGAAVWSGLVRAKGAHGLKEGGLAGVAELLGCAQEEACRGGGCSLLEKSGLLPAGCSLLQSKEVSSQGRLGCQGARQQVGREDDGLDCCGEVELLKERILIS